MIVQNGIDDLIGTLIALHFGMPVNENRQQTAQRQQENQPHMLAADMGHKVQGVMESCANQTAHDAHDCTE